MLMSPVEPLGTPYRRAPLLPIRFWLSASRSEGPQCEQPNPCVQDGHELVARILAQVATHPRRALRAPSLKNSEASCLQLHLSIMLEATEDPVMATDAGPSDQTCCQRMKTPKARNSIIKQ